MAETPQQPRSQSRPACGGRRSSVPAGRAGQDQGPPSSRSGCSPGGADGRDGLPWADPIRVAE